MVDKKKLRLMIKLARYEKKEERETLRLAKYFRNDYLGIELFKNFFWITLGYGLGVMGVACYFMDYLMDHLHKMNLSVILAGVIGGYLIVCTIYSVYTYIKHTIRYSEAEASLKQYNKMLNQLEKIYENSEGFRRRSDRGGRTV